jgi:hypothetical protein
MSTPTDTTPPASDSPRRWVIRKATDLTADATSKLCIADPLKDDGSGRLTVDYTKVKAAKPCASPWTPAQATAENGLRADAAGLWVPPTGTQLFAQEIPEESFVADLQHGVKYYTDRWSYKSSVLDLQVSVTVNWWINVYLQNAQVLHSMVELFLSGDVKKRPLEVDESPWTNVGKITLDDGSPNAFMDYYARLARSTAYVIPPGGTAVFGHRVGLQFTSYSNRGATAKFVGNSAAARYTCWLIDPCYGLAEGKDLGPVVPAGLASAPTAPVRSPITDPTAGA